MLTLALALSVPPHGRVNYRCYPVWSADRRNLNVVWDGEEYAQPWVFDAEVDDMWHTCAADACVQRLFCTDSGAVGRYAGTWYSGKNVTLDYAWLRDTRVSGSRVLAAHGRENGDSTLMADTNYHGPGAVLVVGDTLFFYTHDHVAAVATTYGLPRLSSLVFGEYAPGMTAEQLVSVGLDAVNILGVGDAYYWISWWSPVYPSGKNALTVSVEDYFGGSWAVDAALTVASGKDIARRTLVHYSYDAVPSTHSTSRDILTTPRYSCRAPMSGAGTCYVLGSGMYTWDDAAVPNGPFKLSFTALRDERSFALPRTLWLFAAQSYGSSSPDYRVLATYGLGSVVAFDGDVFYGVERRPTSGCAAGGLYLVSYDVAVGTETPLGASPLIACATEITTALPSHSDEVPYAATAVKWVGPWQEGFALLVAQSIRDHEYALLARDSCAPGSYRDGAECLACPRGFFCPGALDSTEEKRRCPAGSFAAHPGMARCEVPSGRCFRYPGSVELCPADSFCPGGLSEPVACPAGTHSRSGAWSAAQCT